VNSDSKYTILGYDRMAVEKCKGKTWNITGYSADRRAPNLLSAKQQVKHVLSELFRVAGEMSERLVYASVHLGGEDGECVYDEWNPDYRLPTEKEFAYEAALMKLVRTIENSGGVIEDRDGQVQGCAADEDWLDLAHAYVDACEALGRMPMIADEVR
jgi:mRNA degradation ribonuclease J1/J2